MESVRGLCLEIFFLVRLHYVADFMKVNLKTKAVEILIEINVSINSNHEKIIKFYLHDSERFQ